MNQKRMATMTKNCKGIIKIIFLAALVISSISAFTQDKNLPTVPTVDFKKYLGKWYEIARLPNNFEKGMYCVTANYSMKNGKRMKVINSGYVEASKTKKKTSTGIAKLPNPLKPGELKVSFFKPFSGDYFIIHLDEDYTYSLVGTPDRNYLWILSRTPQMDDQIFNQLVKIAQKHGFKTDHLLIQKQDCGN